MDHGTVQPVKLWLHEAIPPNCRGTPFLREVATGLLMSTISNLNWTSGRLKS
jgi:hypothetical protein